MYLDKKGSVFHFIFLTSLFIALGFAFLPSRTSDFTAGHGKATGDIGGDVLGTGIPRNSDSDPSSVLVSRNKFLSLQALTPHNPININGNSGFDTSPGNWTGSGTWGDPYTFMDYYINASVGLGILIANTDAYFIIRNVLINGSTNCCTGAFHFNNVSNGELINNTAVNNNGYGFFLTTDSKNNTLRDNLALSNAQKGYYLSFSSNNNTLRNNIATNGSIGFHFYVNSNNNTLSDNSAIENVNYGFYLDQSSNNNYLHNNSAAFNSMGFYLTSGSSNNVLINNYASNSSNYGY